MSNEIDAAAAAEAMNAAGGIQQLMAEEAGTAKPKEVSIPAPEGTSNPGFATTETPTLAEAPSAVFTQGPPAPAADNPGFAENFDPNSLPPELLPAYKQMQADYTRKTQDAAPFRSLAEQFGEVDADTLAQAMETYQTLQDPTSWKQLHEELTQQLGLTPAEATQVVEEQVAQDNNPRAILDQLADPEYAPLRSAFEGLYGELDSLRAEQAQREAQAQEEAAIQSMAAEIKRQENLLRQSRPDYTDDDFTAIYELSPVYEGNLVEAAKRYDGMMQSRIERYLASKTEAAGNPGNFAIPGGTAPVAPVSDFNPKTLDDPMVDAAVNERIAQLQALEQGGEVG